MIRVDGLDQVMIELVLRRRRGLVPGELSPVSASRSISRPCGTSRMSLAILVAIHSREADVDDPHVRTHGVEQFKAADAVGGVVDLVTGELEHHPQRVARVVAVLDQQHSPGRHTAFWCGERIEQQGTTAHVTVAR